MIKEMQRNAAFMDPTRAAAHLAGATGDAMKTAAGNPNGALGAFMGMGMAGGMAGAQMGNLYQQGAQQQAAQPTPAPAPAVQGWTCSCGRDGQHGQVLRELRQAGSGERERVDVQLRREEHGQVLLELRQARARRRVDLRVRHDEQLGRLCSDPRQALRRLR